MTREETYVESRCDSFRLVYGLSSWFEANSETETKQNSVSMQPICNEYSFMRRRIVKWAMKNVHTLEYIRKWSAKTKTKTNMNMCADRCSRRFYLLEILWKWPIKSWAILCIWMEKKISNYMKRGHKGSDSWACRGKINRFNKVFVDVVRRTHSEPTGTRNENPINVE